jgi:hypothetical protein
MLSLYCHTGDNGARNLASTHSTSALEGGELSASLPSVLYSRGKTQVPTGQEAAWVSELVWAQRLEESSLSLPGIECLSPGRTVSSHTLY